jgi:hypothetical protein
MRPSITIRSHSSLSSAHRRIAKDSLSFPACGASPGAPQGVKWGSKSWVDRGPQQPLPSSTTSTTEGERVWSTTHCAWYAGKNAAWTWTSAWSVHQRIQIPPARRRIRLREFGSRGVASSTFQLFMYSASYWRGIALESWARGRLSWLKFFVVYLQ